ncbi:DinB family protein [Streptomyces armeniacus]|uniref:DinB family protein n=1 Tax=Streptomyces armeniacus TaxID=83291 RepID=A0A345XIC0_9ACTN|nr:DinB family protein [Streptomyces armeniacus]AXK31386.1 DinB family protein [Streptomyces armeniacus]
MTAAPDRHGDAPGGGPSESRDEPARTVSDPHELLAGQLEFHRDTLLWKLAGLPESELRASRVASGWTPLELVWHLVHVERRWLCWGFRAERVPDPWGDDGPDGRWQVPEGMTTGEVLERFAAQRDRSRAIIREASLLDRAAVGGRFGTPEEAPTLGWILCHLLQEYARHVGQLDIVRELADGAVGE